MEAQCPSLSNLVDERYEEAGVGEGETLLLRWRDWIRVVECTGTEEGAGVRRAEGDEMSGRDLCACWCIVQPGPFIDYKMRGGKMSAVQCWFSCNSRC